MNVVPALRYEGPRLVFDFDSLGVSAGITLKCAMLTVWRIRHYQDDVHRHATLGARRICRSDFARVLMFGHARSSSCDGVEGAGRH
jgi:hypothetical protein